MSHILMTKILCLEKGYYPLVNKFYKQYGGRGKAKSNEQVWVAKTSEIVAACRLVRLDESELLCGVLVCPDMRGQGIARQLIVTLCQHKTQLYTFAYSHLKSWYQSMGFEHIFVEQASLYKVANVVVAKFELYKKQGRQLVLLRYTAGSANV